MAGRLVEAIRELPGHLLRHLFIWLSRRRSLQRLALSRGRTRGFVFRFVAGETLDEALTVLARLKAAGFLTAVDILGESVTTAEAAEAAADRYLVALDALAARGLDPYVSLKLTQMGLAVDPDLCRRNLRRILERAAATGAFVRIDMEDSSLTQTTLDLWRELHAEFPGIGAVIQAYLRRSAADVEALIAEGARVRLCKGAYDEPASVAFPAKREVDGSFRRLAERLLVGGVHPALATHDERLIEGAIAFARRGGIGPERFEFQMLYGVRRDLQERLVREGYRMRVYVPYGTEWYPYFMRRLAERPANALFILRSVLRDRPGRS
ncbi:MAG: hypothetical protein A2X23_00430 [Chloroflexi bacterium GWC2_73_18]|nr:MAG: hypothetical protein A2X23_00430 [Chloroflexi bacterium GWC2_73_18]